MSGLLDSLLPNIDSILSVRDSIGAVVQPVYFVERSWYDDSALTIEAVRPDGYASDMESLMQPSPRLKKYFKQLQLQAGGMIQSGDILLTGVSRQAYRQEDLDSSSSKPNVEYLYRVGDKIYQVIQISERSVTWEILLRELTQQQRYV